MIRRDLTPAQRAKLIAKRKAAYEAVHPETKQGGAPGKAGGGKTKTAKMAGFAADTAAKSGKPLRTVERDITRSRKLGPDLDRVAGTSLDKGAELDALAAMPAEAGAPLIQRAAAVKAEGAQRGR
ncbi:hypothetical protein ACVWZR_004570 [Bradyrhizobium sp. i1.3.1]